MKIYRRIVIVCAIVLGIGCGACILFSPNAQEAINDPVTDEDYDYLKENAIEVAKTQDKSKVSDKNLKADYYFDESQLVVIVESTKAKVTATIPIKKQVSNIQGEKIEYEGIIEFENVQYGTENKLFPAIWYILASFIVCVCGGAFVYGFLFEFWNIRRSKIKQ